MAKPFDATTKELIEAQPDAWLHYAGLPSGPVTIVDADLSTVTTSADKVLRVEEPVPWLAHLEPQASYEADLDERILQYSVLLRRRHHLPVRSAILLLRREADGPSMTGLLEYQDPDGVEYLRFRYRVVRAWEKPVEEVLAGGLATLPLAPLADVRSDELPQVIRRMEARIAREAASGEAATLWTATYLLMGLRYPPELATQLLQGVRGMKESTTYQAILAEGREEGLEQGLEQGREEGREVGREEGRLAEARRMLVRLGGRRFGSPSAEARAAIEEITSVERLEALTERLLDVESWEELLAG